MNIRKHFTLIELIVSIVVIGILAAIIMLNISDLRLQAEETAYAVNEKEVQSAVDRYKLKHGEYPTTPQPTKDNPQLVEMDKIVSEFVRKKPKGDFVAEVDDKGKVTIIKGENPAGSISSEGASESGFGDVLLPYTPITCEEAETQGYICIYTPEELDAVRNNMEAKYILMNDISLASYANWNPIGRADNPFKGTLNGNGMSITNLVIGASPTDVTVKGLLAYMTYGEIMNLSIVDAQANRAGEDNTYYTAATSFLVGKVISDSTNNPESKAVKMTNISLTGTASDVDKFAPLIDSAFTDSPLIINNIRTDVTVTAVEDTAGVVRYYGQYEGYGGPLAFPNALITVKNVEVNGSMASTQTTSGFFERINLTNSNHDITIENIRVNANLTADKYSNGFAYFLVATGETTAMSVRNVEIHGDIVTTNVNRGYSAIGFTYTIQFQEAKASLIENIKVTSDLTGPYETSAFAFNIYYDLTTHNHTIRNIDIASKIISEDIYGFAVGIYHTNASGKSIIEDVDIQIVGEKDWLYSTIDIVYSFSHGIYDKTRQIPMEGSNSLHFERFNVDVDLISKTDWEGEVHLFIDDLNARDLLGDVVIKDININANVVNDGEIYGFIDELEQSQMTQDGLHTGRVLVENINLSGSLTSTLKNVHGFVDRFQYNADNSVGGPIVLRNVGINYAISANNGTAYVPVTEADLRSYYFGARNDGQSAYTENYEPPTSQTPFTIENVTPTWTLTGHTGATSRTR